MQLSLLFARYILRES